MLVVRVAVAAIAALGLACTGRTPLGQDADSSGAVDAHDAADVRPDTQPIDPCAPSPCGAAERCGPLAPDGGRGPGNGLDDNCNGTVDEGCLCVTDQAESCFTGPPDRRNIGACRDGTVRCGELGLWGTCTGDVVPHDEVCDGIDNNCDGRVDENLSGCASSVRCPANAGARPLSDATFDGREIDPMATTFAWTFACPASVSPCPMPVSLSNPAFSVRVIQSGTYRVAVTLTRADGTVSRCGFPLYVQGAGLRVELDWDTKGGINSAGTDLDLHIAPIDRTRTVAARWFTTDDCYYATCVAPGGTVSWTTSPTDRRFAPSTDVALCSSAPPPHGDAWRAAGRCWNPRLDVDDVQCDPTVRDATRREFCFVENINVDEPPHAVTFRLAVNFYRDHGTCTDSDPRNDVTHPRMLIHCGGLLRGEIGGVDEGQIGLRCDRNTAIGSTNWTWLAADVQFATNACGLEDCTVLPIRVSGSRFAACDVVMDRDDACQDASGRLFVRRAAQRPVDGDVADPF